MNLNPFKETNLFNAGTSFFKQLNIPLNSNTTTSLYLKDILKDKFKSQEIFEKVSETYFLGLVDKSVFADNLSLFDDGNVTFDQAVEKIHADYEGMMIFAVQIKGIVAPTRTQLADLTRAFNRTSQSLPVVVLFQYGNLITLATSERTKYKQTWREGEKVGKVSLLRDIDIQNPHTGHLKILLDLVIKPDARDFSGLYEQWMQVFDVQLLNRNFYKELSTWYFWALRKVEFPDDAEKNKEIRNSTSVIRLITRLIFVWFLKEKRLVPEILFNKKALDEYLRYDDINNSTYYKAILQNLFFATLNTKMKKDDKESRKFVNRQYGVQVFYRYERYFKDKKKALKLFEAIPFLNGGLFENLDKNIGKDDEIRIDCFTNSPKKSERLKVPDSLFFGDKIQIDLSKEFGNKKRKKETVRGIIHILNSYKFTITENTPIEEEIALDPELLGKVFENLLASYNPETQTTARKQTGSFYTPREIVNYMVDESLKASLSNLVSKKIDNATEDDIKTGLDILFEYTEKEHAFTDNEVSKIVEAISELKILDPACGSGAFPMGILHKLVFILNKIDGDNKKWRELQKQTAVKETEKAYSVGDKEERHQRLKEIEEAFDFNTSNYGRKLFLIENSIYGVDIQPIAVQIAKLRFFISLIVDQNIDEDKENLGILPLPNLETKFVAANTLIGIDKKGQLELNFQNFEINEKEKELAKVRERHFLARTPQTKEKYREKDKSLRNEIAVLLEKDGFASDVTKKLAHWDPYDQNTHADFFDMEWMFGVKDGFDVVIGNPPYGVSIKGDYRKAIVSYLGKVPDYEIYYYFIEIAYILLNKNGIKTFIIPNTILFNVFAAEYRLAMFTKWQINEILDCTDFDFFEKTTIRNIITRFSKKKTGKYIGYKNTKDATSFMELSDRVLLFITQDNLILNNQNWSLAFKLDTKVLNLIIKIRTGHKKLCDYFPEFSQGLIAYDKYRGQSKEIIESRAYHYNSKVNKKLKPWLWGSDVNRYRVEWNKEEYIDYCDGLANPRKPKYFKGKRILVREITNPTIYAGYTDKELYNDPAIIIILEAKKIDLLSLLAILNSALATFYHFNSSPKATKGAFPKILVNDIKNFPLVKLNTYSKKIYRSLSKLSEKILIEKKADSSADTTSFEAEIDGRVAHLYNLTEEEYSLILKETNCPDPFRVAALNVYRDIARGKLK
jgi:hypothetical protein